MVGMVQACGAPASVCALFLVFRLNLNLNLLLPLLLALPLSPVAVAVAASTAWQTDHLCDGVLAIRDARHPEMRTASQITTFAAILKKGVVL